MSIEGLDFILKKQEVVPTVSARDLRDRPEQVEADYKRHVRTYVPISRSAEGSPDSLTVSEFERKTIKQVKEAHAPRGYLTADYGYGKTSTALYLWQRAEAENLLTVPPFQLLQLSDLVMAIYGWVRYRLTERQPALIDELDKLYAAVSESSIEREARDKDISEAALREYVAQGRFTLELQSHDYIEFFQKVTDIARSAGYAGVLVLPDELQQYIEPRIRRDSEPITPLFNLVQLLATRNGYLAFGIIFVIPLKEVGVIREMRDDLLHRMRELSLDLTAVYDDQFARNLWYKLAHEFDFTDLAQSHEIIDEDTLLALGEIAARQELSNGPRTVINAFRRIVERYKSMHLPTPYTPINLIDDFISGAIPFAGNDQIPNVTRRALQSQIVRTAPDRYERAIKLAAAFPTNGVPVRVQRAYHVEEALEDLRRQALGELVISAGLEQERGVTLFGLHIGVQQSDWLSQTVRDFRRGYSEQQSTTKDRAITVFDCLLKTDVFKGWKLIEEIPATMIQNHSLIFEGSHQSYSSSYPNRRIHVRIFWEDEELKDATTNGDVLVEYYLTLRSDLRADPEARRDAAQPLQLDFNEHAVRLPINLLYMRPEGLPMNLKQALQGVWSPYDLSPLVLMNLYALMDEKRLTKLIPPRDDEQVAHAFQPELLDTIRKDLFNAQISTPLGGVTGAKITEDAIRKLLEARFPDYQTLMTGNWQSALQTHYANAISQLETIYQKRGEVEVENTKEEISKLLGRGASSLDSYRRQNQPFLTVVRDWGGRDSVGAVKFTLHPLENLIIDWLRNSLNTERVMVGTIKVEVHLLNVGDVYREAQMLGYKDEEVGLLLDLMVKRELLEFYQKHRIREVPSQTVDLDAAAHALSEFRRDLTTLSKGFAANARLTDLQNNAAQWAEALEKERQGGTPDPQTVHKLGKAVQARHKELHELATEKRGDLLKRAQTLEHTLRPINPRHLEALNKQIEASVEYVGQVNVLRMALRTHATSVKAALDKVKTQVDESLRIVNSETLSYETLARATVDVDKLDQQIQGANEKLVSFEEFFRHFNGWGELTELGSAVREQLDQMGQKTATQNERFEELSRNIKADVSSKTNKMEALPHYTIHAASMREVQEQVRSIRRSSEDEFHNLQNRYQQAFVSTSLYPREKLGKPFDYNPANADESARLVYDRASDLMRQVCEQLGHKANEERLNVERLLFSEAFRNVPDEELQAVHAEASELVNLAEQAATNAANCLEYTTQEDIIRDFPASNMGRFAELLHEVAKVRDDLKSILERAKTLTQHVTASNLTFEEDTLLQQLQIGDLDTSIDILDWLKNTNVSTDDFWRLLRCLYDKRRIRLSVGRVRI